VDRGERLVGIARGTDERRAARLPVAGVSPEHAAGLRHRGAVAAEDARRRRIVAAGIASRLVVTEKAVNKHIGNIFTKLGLYPDEDANRRVLAVLTYLNA
jgi:hypothetical protein